MNPDHRQNYTTPIDNVVLELSALESNLRQTLNSPNGQTYQSLLPDRQLPFHQENIPKIESTLSIHNEGSFKPFTEYELAEFSTFNEIIK
ncbi:hypothetical protein BLNAU_13761 [Blattamonas nauphoetae]|uniref:Uncharacterized protein n=1 Tax=Blattamonas nauphoetae TaxID=2049346 RepID=A0ABQ9XHU0_9EUKA|nr:hypothetical protein BLNAU_13761 [Blattamonas nauphoetae]